MAFFSELAKQHGISDEEIKKYSTAQPTTQPTPKRSFLEKTGAFLGVEQLGKGLGLALFQLTPEYKELVKRTMEGTVSPEEFESIATGGLTSKQVLASGARTALTFATAGMGTPAKLAPRVALHAGLGAAEAGLGQVSRGEEVSPEVVGAGAALGAFIPEAFRGVGNLINKLTKKLPSRLMNSAVKPTNPNLGQQLVDRGLMGTEDDMLKKSLDKISNNEFKLDEFLQKKEGAITADKVISTLDDLKLKYKSSPKVLKLINKEIKDWVVQDSYTPLEANVQKRILYETLGDRAYRAGVKHSAQVGVLKQLARGFKEGIEEIIPEVTPINTELGVYSQARKALTKRVANLNKQQLGVWGDIMVASGGGLFAGIPGGLAAIAVKRGAEAGLVKTTVAGGLSKLGKLIEKLPTDKAGRIGKSALMNLLAQMKIEE